MRASAAARARLLALALGLLASAAQAGSEHGDAGATVALDKDSFDGFLSEERREGRPCLVMFHVDWCKVCQRVFPKFAAGSTLIRDKGIPMKFAHVDCTNDKTLCQRYSVRGYPTMKFFPVEEAAEHGAYRGARTEEGFLQYAERMTRPAVRSFESAAAFGEALDAELFTAFVAVADAGGAPPAAFVTVAGRWQDRHIFAAGPKLEDLLPASVAVPAGASLAAVSGARQQWQGRAGAAQGQPAVLFFDGSLSDAEAVAQWIEGNRWPGVWSLGESTFFEFTHSGRNAAIVVLDPANVSEAQEKSLRSAAARLREHYVFGTLDGVSWAEELRDFNIHRADLPRVFVTVDDFGGWYEDAEELRLDTLEADLEGLHNGSKNLLQQGRGVVQRLQLYQREALRYARQLYAYAQRGWQEAALAAAAVAAGLAALMTAGWCAVACCRVLMSEEFPEGHTKRE